MNGSNLIERFNQWVSTSITVKMLSVGILILLLLIPKSMITSLIMERQARMQEALNEITTLWPGNQRIAGPIVTVPYRVHYEEDEEMKTRISEAHFLPETLNVKTEIIPEERHRGIFKVIVYRSKLKMNGAFAKPDFSRWNVAEEDILWKDAKISIGISDLRGLEENVGIDWDSKTLQFEPGMVNHDFLTTGINTSIPMASLQKNSIDFTMNIDLKGSKSLFIEPLGKETQASFTGNWPSPSFNGAFLPDNYEISDNNFKANWTVLHFNRNYPQQWLSSIGQSAKASFGVDLFQPAGHYQKSLRTSKYAILMITLTFLVYFLAEIILKVRIHPFQYILIGLALCIFYTLLLSISEHTGFDLAYGISGIAVTTLISLYSKTFLKHKLAGLQVAGTLVIFYTFMYIIIRMEDYALLTGSTGLFIVLGLLMYLTRKINWYKGNEQRA